MEGFSKNIAKSNFMDIRPVEVEFFEGTVEGQNYGKRNFVNLKDIFRSFSNALLIDVYP